MSEHRGGVTNAVLIPIGDLELILRDFRATSKDAVRAYMRIAEATAAARCQRAPWQETP